MIAYLIDEISPEDMRKVQAFLREHAVQSSLEHLFWIELPQDILSEEQFAHRGCGPHVFAVETGPDFVKMEFFIRSMRSLRCSCPGYCTPQQRAFVIQFAHHMLEVLHIRT